MALNKEQRRKRIHHRIRKKVHGTATKPRLAVYRSNKEIYVQLIDDVNGHTLAAANSKELGASGSKVEQSKAVGKLIAEQAGYKRTVLELGG
ncbi:MAG: 50S ribosomal protein L18, partial [Bacteroidota bacterium]